MDNPDISGATRDAIANPLNKYDDPLHANAIVNATSGKTAINGESDIFCISKLGLTFFLRYLQIECATKKLDITSVILKKIANPRKHFAIPSFKNTNFS
ncbi:hypothetical protein FACS1894126_5170 [Alphaproteobacteria bacterium]|nr:hypothetical protein FACS1894126_5170 [Alphaproteobacteria bacterium]